MCLRYTYLCVSRILSMSALYIMVDSILWSIFNKRDVFVVTVVTIDRRPAAA